MKNNIRLYASKLMNKKWNKKNEKKSTDISVWYFFSKQDFFTFI